MAAGLAGHPELVSDLHADPDYSRRALEAVKLIDPSKQPHGFSQKSVDVLTQGALAGALTGGASLPKVAMGAGMGALASGTGAATEAVTGSPAAGAIAGMAVPGAVGKIAGGSRKLPDNVRKMKEEGVQMTPGQILGGKAKDLESGATSFPILGTSIKSAFRRGHESAIEAVANRALSPVGEKLPNGLTGNKAVEYVEHTLGEHYEDLYSKSKGSLYNTGSKLPAVVGQPTTPGMSFDSELTKIRDMAVQGNMPPEQLSQLDAILQKEIRARFNQHGLASGENIKDIESFLGKFSKKKMNSDNYHDQELGGAIKEAQAALRRMMERENPQHAVEFHKLSEGWANFKRMQGAAASVAAQDGVFTPAQLHRSVKTQGKTKDDAAFARGRALMQDFSSAAKDVLSPSVPDSGTALRTAIRDLYQHPLQGVAGGVASMLYSPPAQRAIQTMLTQENPAIAEAARRSVIPLGITQDDINRAKMGNTP
jgi:hypothetical protein